MFLYSATISNREIPFFEIEKKIWGLQIFLKVAY